jgi:4-amino-4-deoxy-L-arabinose transferase-like glycosyltransferase
MADSISTPALEAEPRHGSLLRDLGILSVFALLILFLRLGNSRFWDQDEGYYATVAYEMYKRGDWIVPTFNEQLFAHKPPMMFWGMLMGFHALGVSEFSARLPSAIFGFGSVLLVYFLARRIFDRATGLVAGLVMVSCLMFTVVARSATADAHLTFFVLLAIYLWSVDALRSVSRNGVPNERFHIRWKTWAAIYGAMGCAVLCKGPIGLAFPVTILASVHILEPMLVALTTAVDTSLTNRMRIAWRMLNPTAVVRSLWRMRPLTGLVVVCMVAGPWFIAMERKTGGGFLEEFLGVHHFQRFAQPMDNHSGPFYYYILACLVGLYPWSAFAIPTLLRWFRPEARVERLRGWLLVTMWIAVYLIVFSLASTKLPNYIVPAYPAFAIIIGSYMASWSSLPNLWESRWQRVGWGCMMCIGLLVIILPLILASDGSAVRLLEGLQIDDETWRTVQWVSLLGIPLVLGGMGGFVLTLWQRRRGLAPCFAITSAAMMILFWQVLVPLADQHQTPQDIASALSQTPRGKDEPPSIAVLGYFRPSMVFYANNAVDFLPDVPSLVERLNREPQPVIVLKEKSLQPIQQYLPEGYRVTQSRAEFPKRGRVLVLQPEPHLRR